MAFPMAGSSSADCGPVNPMAGLMKQFQQDRSLQQERFVGDQHGESSKGGFRTGHQQLASDRQFTDEFMNDTMTREQVPGMFEFNNLGRELETIQHGPPPFQHQQHHGREEWSGDFMRQHTHSEDFEGVFQQPHLQQHQQQPQQNTTMVQQRQHFSGQRYTPRQHFQPLYDRTGSFRTLATATNTTFENEQFERAFDAANKEAQMVDQTTGDDWASEFVEKDGITDNTDNNDALARTAAMLLDSVDVNDNPKFKNSQFMSLMQKLRDGSVHVEGDKMVESSSSSAGKEPAWASEFNGQAQQLHQYQQNHANGGRDWVDDFIPQAGDVSSGDMRNRMMTESTSQQGGGGLTEEEMQRVYGRGTEMDDWMQQYQHNIDQLNKAKDTAMQQDTVNSDYDTYNFTTNNPYLMDHSAIDNAQHATLTDSVLALEAKTQLETNNAEAWQALGLRQQENEHDASAIAALKKAVSLNPGLLDGWLALSVSYTNENCRVDAYNSLEQWIANNPTYQHLLTQRPAQDDRHGYITDLFLEAARSSPGAEMDADVQVGLGVLFNVSEEYEKAIDCFKAALASRPQDYMLWNKLGATLANSKNTPGAIDAYFNALEINPSYVRARYNLAISCINMNQHKEAAEHLLTALALQQQENVGQTPTAANTSGPMVNSISMPTGMSENVWDSLRMVMYMMKREDLAVQCERRNLDIFRSEFDF